ncbi:hypothetical protein LXA43DRAFT_864965, partial [Ganoderma leucocontextum]
ALQHGILAVTHPEQYAYLQALQEWVLGTVPLCGPVLGDWPFIHSSAQIIANRVTPYHRDRSSPISFHDMLLTMGTYGEQAVIDLENLGVSVPYESGTMLSLAAYLVSHGAPMCNGNHIC